MIVKKIARSKAAPAKSKAAHVRALADYIAGPQAGGHGEKLEHRGALNLLNLDHDGQVEEMIDLAETARRSPQPVQHWILSWREGEQPTTAQADEAVKMFLGEMGLADHQAIYALHRDTHNWHLHLAINRVHPDTEKLITVNGRFDHEVAHRAIARIEHRQCWEPEAYALYGPDAADQIIRLRPRDPSDRKVSVNARDFEERRGERSAERVAIEDAAPIMRQATSWRELHEGLAAQGIRFETKGSGALLWIGDDRPVKASAAGRDCSMAALRKRLGKFEPALSPSAHVPVAPRPVDVSRPYLPSYIAERHKHLVACTQGRDLTTARQREEWGSLVDRHRKERADIFRGSWRGKRGLLSALRSVTAARQAQEKAELRDRQRLERTAIARERGSFPSYEEWLAARDLDAADNWRHRQRRPATIEGPTFKAPVPHDIRAVHAVVDGPEVNYYMARPRGVPSFTDRGKTIDVYDTRSRESILAALQLSAQKWGTISVRGDDQFKRTCVELAAEHGFRITNPELQHAIAAKRGRRTTPNREEQEVPSDSGRQQLMTPAAIYRRHRDAIVREQPGQRIDPSRVDARVAVRLAVTGHSRDQIADAIKAGASGDRPGEKRDWEQYAQRVATVVERRAVLDVLHEPRFADQAPAEVYARLLDEDRYLCSERTMYRILADNAEVRERRDQLRHPAYKKPELLATAPNQVWSWDITKLLGPAKWTYLYLYVVLDIFSRYVVGWMIAHRESATLAKRLIEDSCQRHGIRPGQLSIHADRGPSMTSKTIAHLYADLGVTQSHSRPNVSNDNPFSEAQFKTLKYRPDFPERFGSAQHGRVHCAPFFDWYNREHRHGGIGLLTPHDVHHGLADQRVAARARILAAAHAAHPERFPAGVPTPPPAPTAVWINPPALAPLDAQETH